jgi:D-alanine-D-alanine ligase-like ATP-grasp enzyme
MPTLAKLRDRGYWVSHHFYWQSLVHYFLYSAKFRSFTFFSACDPAIELGGMLDENKSDIYALLPSQYVPNTINVTPETFQSSMIEEHGLKFPLIVKPNIGFKGYKVVLVHTVEGILKYLQGQDQDREWLIQEYLDYEREYSLLYYRYPDGSKAGITSLIEKVYPSVSGDGKSTLKELVEKYDNAFLDRMDLQRRFGEILDSVPDAGEIIQLDTIGNYSRGSKFYSMMEKIDEELINATTAFFSQVKDIDFFRMDFKADDLEAYKAGNFGILEINGTKSEPLHIYDPRYDFWDRTKTLNDHWKIIAGIVNNRRSVSDYQFPSTRVGLKSLFSIKKLVD